MLLSSQKKIIWISITGVVWKIPKSSSFLGRVKSFKLFEHSKYMIICKIVNLWSSDSFPNRSILEIYYCSKLNNFRNFMFFEIAKYGKFFEFATLQIFGIFKYRKFVWIFRISTFFKLHIFGNFQIDYFSNFPNLKFLELSKFEN